MMSVAAWLVWRKRREHPTEIRTALGCFVFQLALNAAWSWLFFGLHQTGLAYAEILALWLTIAATPTPSTSCTAPSGTPFIAAT